MKTILLPLGLVMMIQVVAFSQATHPFTNCPDVNVAIVRAGTNSDISNPYFLYHVNQSTGAMTLVAGGPYKDPASPAKNLQVNGFGVSRKDGFMYGIAFDGTATTARFMRLDGGYGVTDLGAIPSPSSPTGTIGIVNPAAGDMDTSGNFYFSALTANLFPTPSIDKLFIGKIANTQSMVSGPPIVEYFEVDVSGANCSGYVSTLTSDPNNSGLKDFSYNSKTKTFFTYATYKLPGASNFSAQLLELTPIAGSSPLKYRLVCNSTINTHTAETAGTLIDKDGRFTVLFTDGSFGMLNQNASGVYTGGFTMITTTTGLPNPLRGDMGSCGQGSPNTPPTTQPTPFPNCPDADVAIARAGTNSDITNPYFLYNVNQSTGAMTLVPGGPYKDPVNPAINLQVNGIGVSRKDGFIYGIAFNGGPGSTNITARFMRLGANYGATDLGVIAPPPAGPGQLSFVNTAAGDMDTSGNFYFSAFTINLLPTPTLVKFYLGKIANTQSMTAGPPVTEYFEVDVSGANCSNYISTLTSDPNNSGLKDFSYNSKTNTFFTYATYKLPGASNFSAQLLELVPIAGSSPLRYRLVCNSTVNTHTAETAGTLIDKNGKFTVLFTDGSFGMLNGNASSGFSGGFTLITTTTGLTNPLRGDMGSCGQGSPNTPPATQPTPFPNCPDVDVAIARAGTNSDITNPYFLYNVNQSTGAMTLVPGGPYKDPASPAINLQVNGIGVSRKDGFIYGIAFNGSPTSTTITARFMRLGANYGATDLGVIAPPSAGPGQLSFVNTAAGDMDTSGNFYFSAFTINLLPTPTLVKFYLGKIANTQSMITGPPVAQYFEVDVSGANCSNYISTLTSDPNNSGLKDFSFNAKTNTFFTYATYKLPGASGFSAQLLELVPITGSSPLRYRLVCNSTVNTHTAETAGTLIDKNGKFTVLFTDGSFGMLNGNASSGFNGGFTMITTSTRLPNPLRGDMGSCGQGASAQTPASPFTCPGNIGIARAGTNADITNPYSLYTVNGTTGAFTLLPGGPLFYPGTSQALQLNGIGINKADGMIYGMAFEGSLNTARFVKVDGAYHVTLLGNIPPPVSSGGSPGFVNSAAGDIDNQGNYYFTAVTTKAGNGPGGMVIEDLWLGKIANVSSVTGTPSPVYKKIEWNGNPCKDFINSLTNDPINSGIKDLFYHPVTKTFFTYATYKLTGDTKFRGQMLELKPVGGSGSPDRYHLQCKNVVNMHNAETSGTMVTDEGEFLVLMTDGTVGRVPRTGASFNYSGQYVPLNNSTGLPSPLRGDLASCTNLKKHHDGDDDDDDQGEDDDDQGENNNNQGHDDKMNCSLYPNPVGFSDNIMVRWTQLPNPMLVNILVYDNNGTIVRRVNNAMAVQGTQVSISVSNLASGLYYVRVMSADGQIEHKLKFIKAN